MTTNFTDILDKPEWRQLSMISNASFAPWTNTTNVHTMYDMRSRDYADPNFFMTNGSTVYLTYNYKNNGGFPITTSNSLGGTLGAGWVGIFSPSNGPSGTITTGATTTSVVLSTALPASVAVNQLANRGDGVGYILRIVGNAAASSGKIEERRIISNTSGTTPTITVSPAFSATPTSGDRYELLSGRLFMMSTGASKEFRYYDIATRFQSTALSTTNLPGTVGATYNEFLALDEAHVPHDKYPGEGFLTGTGTYDITGSFVKNCLTATSSAAGTITGQASSGDASVLTNEYRNFQIRIVEDTTIPTAVGQRRRITSHTAGASPVYTLASNWTVTPSTTCKYVIENDNDKLLWITSASVITYNYNITANTWDTTTWANRSTNYTNSWIYQSFGIRPDANKNSRHSYIFSPRGASNLYDILNIAGGATGAWTNGLTFNVSNSSSFLPVNGTSYAYAPHTQEGRYVYFTNSGSSNSNSFVYRFDVQNQIIEAWSSMQFPASSNATANNKGAYASKQVGDKTIGFFYAAKPLSTGGEYYECLITR